MITIHFFKDGAYVTGHDTPEICTLISFAMWTCMEDCLHANPNVTYYQSANDERHKQLGLSYVKIDPECQEHLEILRRTKRHLCIWIEHHAPSVTLDLTGINKSISWEEALKEAKGKQGLCENRKP